MGRVLGRRAAAVAEVPAPGVDGAVGVRGGVGEGALELVAAGGERRLGRGVAAASSERELAHVGGPLEVPGGGEDLVGVPEVIIERVHRGRRVVAGAGGAGLDSAAGGADRLRRVEQPAAALGGGLAGHCCRDVGVGARQQVADAEVTGGVHGRRRHEAVLAVVRAEGALLVKRPGAARLAQLVPADAGAAAAHIDRVRSDHGPVGAEVAQLQPMHEAVGDRLELRPAVGLRNAGFAVRRAQVAVIRRDRDCGDLVHRSDVGRPVDVDLPDVEGAGIRHRGGEEGRRGAGAIEVAGHEAELAAADVESDEVGGLAGVHRVLVHHAEEGALEEEVGSDLLEEVGGHGDRVIDDAVLWVVVETVAVEGELIAVPGGSGIAGLRHCDALRERAEVVGKGELARQPAVSGIVVEDDRVALVVGLAVAADSVPDRVRRERCLHNIAVLVVDRGQQVDHLHVVVRPHRAVGVGRRDQEAKDGPIVVVVGAVEAGADRGGAGALGVLNHGHLGAGLGAAG